jgi:hypothetical protein
VDCYLTFWGHITYQIEKKNIEIFFWSLRDQNIAIFRIKLLVVNYLNTQYFYRSILMVETLIQQGAAYRWNPRKNLRKPPQNLRYFWQNNFNLYAAARRILLLYSLIYTIKIYQSNVVIWVKSVQ